MRRLRQIPRLASVTAGALLLCGCAAPLAQPVGVPVTSSTTPAGGRIAARPGRPGFVVAAPHGGSDLNTDDMAAEIARRTGFGLVVASGVSAEGGEAPEPEAYTKRVLETAQGPLRFYAELLLLVFRERRQRAREWLEYELTHLVVRALDRLPQVDRR